MEHSAAAIFSVSVPDMRKNNFNAVRLLGACFVMAGHMAAVMGIAVPGIGSQRIELTGVQILFIMGGYLIAKSWQRDPHAGRFLLRRFLRLWPPFAVMILIMCYITGPLLSNLGATGYFHSWWKAWLMNLRFYPVFAQPGVFENNPMPLVTNGSIWTMPVEAAAYLLAPVMMLLCHGKGKKAVIKAGVILTVLLVPDLILSINPAPRYVFYGTDWVAGYHLMVYFAIGIFCSFDEVKGWFRLQAAPIAIFLILLTTTFTRARAQQIVWLTCLPYLVFSFALAEEPLFSKLGSRLELSYGIYLYGFFYQQLVVLWNMNYHLQWNYMACLTVSMTMSAATAAVNCILVENPLTKLTRRITGAWMERGKERRHPERG